MVEDHLNKNSLRSCIKQVKVSSDTIEFKRKPSFFSTEPNIRVSILYEVRYPNL